MTSPCSGWGVGGVEIQSFACTRSEGVRSRGPEEGYRRRCVVRLLPRPPGPLPALPERVGEALVSNRLRIPPDGVTPTGHTTGSRHRTVVTICDPSGPGRRDPTGSRSVARPRTSFLIPTPKTSPKVRPPTSHPSRTEG